METDDFCGAVCTPDELLSARPDWARARKRWVAFWERAATDRPCLDLRAPRAVELPPLPAPQNLEDIWLHPDYVAQRWLRIMESTYFGAEAVPTAEFLLGAYALGCGPGVVFHKNTVWHPITSSTTREPINWQPGPDDPWRHKLDAVINRLLELARGKFLVTYVMQVPVNDLIALLVGPQRFLTELAEDADRCRQRLEELFPLWTEDLEHFRSLIDARQKGCVWGWPGLWHPDMVMVTQSDMSCMVSGEMFDRYVMREMDLLGERYGVLWYHVDGPGAIRHVPRLLQKSYIRAIQYVPGAGQPPNGPAWMELYRQVQAAGRCLDLDVPLENLEYLVRHLRPEGLVLRARAESPDQADELADLAVKWCGSHLNR